METEANTLNKRNFGFLLGWSVVCGLLGTVLSLNECPSPNSYSHVGGVEKQCTATGYTVYAALGFFFGFLSSVFCGAILMIAWSQLTQNTTGLWFVLAVVTLLVAIITWFVSYLVYGTLLFMDGPHFDVLFENK